MINSYQLGISLSKLFSFLIQAPHPLVQGVLRGEIVKMLTLSNKSDYGLLLLTLLARKRKTEYVPLSIVAHESGLPYAFVSKIAAQLSGAGILESREGVSGGYRLLKKPETVSIGRVTEILDGPWAPTKCTEGKLQCSLKKVCPMADNWQNRLKAKMWKILDSYTLKDLME